jgi:hypothetical protein
MKKYSKEDIQRIYNEIKKSSFNDLSENSRLVFKNFNYFGFASPFSLNVLINIHKINDCNLPEDAVKGLIAHEFSHQVSFLRRSYMGRFLYIWSYPFSKTKKRLVEKEADEITIERGFAREMLLMRKYKFNCENEKHLEESKQVYLSVEELERLIDEKKGEVDSK